MKRDGLQVRSYTLHLKRFSVSYGGTFLGMQLDYE